MRATLAFTAVVACFAAVSASNSRCDPSYECGYFYTDPTTHDEYKFEFASLCSETDYVFEDDKMHRYNANVCGIAAQNCLPPTWSNTYEYGVAIQSWGSIPQCTSPPQCLDKVTQKPVCCTADCQVLGTGAPRWSLIDPSNPASGGVQAKYLGAAPSDSDPFWCEFNPATGAQYEREVTMQFMCDPASTSGAVPLGATIAKDNDCHYTLTFNTSLACARPSSGGHLPFLRGTQQ